MAKAPTRKAGTPSVTGQGLGSQPATVPDAMAQPGARVNALPGGSPSDAFMEFGATGLRQFSGYVREEWLRDLQGWRGIRVLREMRDNDAVIGAFFFAIEMLLRGVTFTCEGVTDAPEDQQAADFINSAFFDMEQTWSDLLAEVLTFLVYGWDVHEIVYKVRQGKTDDPKTNSKFDDGLIGWRKFAGRAQESLLHWEFDASGEATALIQLLPTGGPLLRVPLSKALHFRTTVNNQNPEGRTLMRNCYRSWYFKKRLEEIEAIGAERDLTGIPIIWAPPELMKATSSPEQKATYEMFKRVVRDTSRNEQEGFVLPLAYQPVGNTAVKTFDFTLLSTGGRRAFDTNSIIARYDQRISSTVLADFIVLGGGTGSYALARNKTDMFSVAAIGFLDIITSEFNRKAIPDLLALNAMKGNAKLTHGEIARRDLTEIGQYVQSLAMAGVIIPDATLEADLREQAGLPSADQTATRNVEDGEEGSDDGTADPSDGAVDTTPGDAPDGQDGSGGIYQGAGAGARANAPNVNPVVKGLLAMNRGGRARGGR